MSPRTHPNRRGIALIIAMVAITVLSVMAALFAYSMKVEMKLARNSDTDAELVWVGRSGVEKARWILGQQLAIGCEAYDALNQVWAGGRGSLCASNGPLSGVSLKNCEVGDGKYSITITDLERKVNVNTASEAMLQQALTLIGVDASDSPIIAGSLLDWIDADNNTHIGGAESDYYQGSTPPYHAKNGPVDDLSELLLVKGVTPEVYWGGVFSNHPPSAFQNRLGLIRPNASASAHSVGLVDIFTPISGARQININTASAEVLQMVPMIDENAAARIMEFRDLGEGFEDVRPIGSGGKGINEALVYAGFNNQAVPQIASFFTVRSSTFEVQVDAEIGGRTQRFVAILARSSPRDVQILSFESRTR